MIHDVADWISDGELLSYPTCDHCCRYWKYGLQQRRLPSHDSKTCEGPRIAQRDCLICNTLTGVRAVFWRITPALCFSWKSITSSDRGLWSLCWEDSDVALHVCVISHSVALRLFSLTRTQTTNLILASTVSLCFAYTNNRTLNWPPLSIFLKQSL